MWENSSSISTSIFKRVMPLVSSAYKKYTGIYAVDTSLYYLEEIINENIRNLIDTVGVVVY